MNGLIGLHVKTTTKGAKGGERRKTGPRARSGVKGGAMRQTGPQSGAKGGAMRQGTCHCGDIGRESDGEDYEGKQWGFSRKDARGLAALYVYRNAQASVAKEKEARAQVVMEDGVYMMADGTDLCEGMEPFYCYMYLMDEDLERHQNLFGGKDIVVKKNCKTTTEVAKEENGERLIKYT